MSGPKISVYDLTPEQRAVIVAELQIRMRELERRQELLKELHTYVPKLEQLSQALSKYNFVAQEETNYLESSTLRTTIEGVTVSINTLTELMSDSANLQDNAKLEKNLDTISGKAKQIQNAIDDISKLAELTVERLQEVLSSSAIELFARHEESVEISEHNNIHEAQFAALLSYVKIKHLPENLRQKITMLSTRRARIPADSLDNFFAVEVQPVVKKCEDFFELWEKYGGQYELLLQRYEILAKENGRSELSVVPFSTNAISEIEKLIAIEEIEYQRQAEDSYIADSILSAMEEMGYSLYGQREVIRRNGSHYSSSLFQYDRDSAVNVIFSDDGRITMEVGKIDSCDRIPESSESKEIVETMEAFCSDFEEIEKKLALKGVVLKNRIRLSSPTVEHAQIINIAGFTTMTTKSVVKQKRKTKKKPKQFSLQT